MRRRFNGVRHDVCDLISQKPQNALAFRPSHARSICSDVRQLCHGDETPAGSIETRSVSSRFVRFNDWRLSFRPSLIAAVRPVRAARRDSPGHVTARCPLAGYVTAVAIEGPRG